MPETSVSLLLSGSFCTARLNVCCPVCPVVSVKRNLTLPDNIQVMIMLLAQHVDADV